MKSDKQKKTSPKQSHSWRAVQESRGLFATQEGAPNCGNCSIDQLQQRRAKRFLARLRRAILPVGLLLVSVWVADAKTAAVMATLEPAEIAFGDVAQLTVTMQGQDQGTPQLPSVSGLSFQPAGQSSQIQIINGATSANISYNYVISPTRLGTFTIPAIKAGSGPDAAESLPVVLKVLKRTPDSSSVAAQAGHSRNDDTTVAPDAQGFGFLRLVSPKKEFYVGEQVPVELKAFFRAGVELRVDGLPKLNSDAFAMNKLSDQPGRSEQVIGGVPYTVFTWTTALTAVKAGDYEMSVEIPTTVTVRQHIHRPHARSNNPFGDPFFDEVFNDSFFDNFFGSATQKEVALSSEPSAVKILSLPTAARPASFSGAVGNFEVSAEATPLRATIGDPITLKVKLTGSGNFERANAPALERNNEWKTYKPTSKFEPEDSVGCSGTKTFEQALVPLQSGKLTIPALEFSYFDAEGKQYVTRSTRPLSIDVEPGQSTANTAPSAPVALASQVDSPSSEPGMAPNKLAPGRFHTTLRPWFFNPWLAAGALLPSFGYLAVYFVMRRRQSLARDPRRVRLDAARCAVQEQLRVMESAATRGSTLEFLAAARSAFQNQLAVLWGLRPQTITLAEVNTRLNGEADGFRFVFELADEVAYTGRNFSAAELQKWYQVINIELKRFSRI